MSRNRPIYTPSTITLPDWLSWESQVVQYPTAGPPGVSYFEGDVSEVYPDHPPVDCLLWRSEQGTLHGILNHYPVDYGTLERKGNVSLFVDPEWRRQGIATRLVTEAWSRWDTTLRQQTFTVDGAALADHLHRQVGLR